ncbi:MAG: NTP transferase domain-containing protein [Muribaculaceae bacterium]|nr:NTP transferase domain-containing protein [Muribaculaceae bacterium]
MKAMILCAGLGSRLKPWTDSHPKALVPVGGIPMLKRVVDKLADEGFDEVTINVHHFADQIISYLECVELPVNKINISDETDSLLDTGGGILKAEPFLAVDDRPFLVHNVDIVSNADLSGLYRRHIENGSRITLLVSERESNRRLVFYNDMRLKGWRNIVSGETRPSDMEMSEDDLEFAFSGIYVMSPDVFAIMKESGYNGKFPIMDFFLAGINDLDIAGVVQDDLDIIDIGKPDTLHRANLEIG